MQTSFEVMSLVGFFLLFMLCIHMYKCICLSVYWYSLSVTCVRSFQLHVSSNSIKILASSRDVTVNYSTVAIGTWIANDAEMHMTYTQ